MLQNVNHSQAVLQNDANPFKAPRDWGLKIPGDLSAAGLRRHGWHVAPIRR